MPTIKEIKERLATIDDLEHPLFEELILYGRVNQAGYQQTKTRTQKQVDEDLRLENASLWERTYAQGIDLIAGGWDAAH